jgi:ketosteroid isomerase-like protein
MSTEREQQNIAKLRRAYEAFSRGDFDAAVAAGLHPDFEYVPAGGLTPIRGAESFRSWMEPDAFESQAVEPVEIEINGDRALVHQHTTARGAGSGIEVDTHTFAVWTIDHEGLATRLEIFQEPDEADARRAAGLDPR